MDIKMLEKMYKKYHQKHSNEYNMGVWKELCKNVFQKFIDEKDVILELGTGNGEFINNICAEKKYTIDIKEYDNKCEDITFIKQSITDRLPFDDNSIDVIFTSNILEHIEPKSAIENILLEAYRVLKNGGKIVLVGPNIRHINGAYWNYWDHVTPISDLSLSKLLGTIGFNLIYIKDRFVPYGRSHMRRYPIFFIKLYTKLPILWRLFGKQFLIVAKK